MISEITLVNQALAGLYVKSDLTNSDLVYPLDGLARAINRSTEEFNLLIDSLSK